jgi:FolB domain-containing protein
MQDRILIKDLLLRGIIGVRDWEREKRQDILLNIELSVDTRRAGETDSMEDCADYSLLTKRIVRHVESSQRYTVEALAADVARICLQEDLVQRARVRLEKPGALRFARSVGVEILRGPDDFE